MTSDHDTRTAGRPATGVGDDHHDRDLSHRPSGRLTPVARRLTRMAAREAARHLAPVQPRRLLLAAGRRATPSQLVRLHVALGAIEQGHWLASVAAPVPNLPDRYALFAEALRYVRGDAPLYLEFGVYQGRTMRWWSGHLTAPGARLVGFDSFAGLPEDWQPGAPRGCFATGGPPPTSDPRVSFVPGWFDRTLPGWLPPAHDQLIVNIDCDLYSSTRCVLDWLTPRLTPGALVYFDDLLGRDDELRALREWLRAADGRAVPLAMARWGQHMLFGWR